MTNLDKYKKDLDNLLDTAVRLQLGFLKEVKMLESAVNKEEVKNIKPLDFRSNYEAWYTEALAIIKQLIPSRLQDFICLYRNEKRKELNHSTYTISDHLIGVTITRYNYLLDGKSAFPKFQQQFGIIQSIKQRFESSLFDIKQLVQADLFDSEIATARELNKKGFTRAAGAICGVMIEKHLGQVCTNHSIALSKRNPTIADLNDILKTNEVVDMIKWRFIQRLGDLRNLCSHNKEREPTKEEVGELIDGTDNIIKTIF
jgi:hypothetical protein